VNKVILVYGVCGGLLIAGLKMIEYRFLVVEHSLELYGGSIALLFAALGIRLGLTLTRTREVVVVRERRRPPGRQCPTMPTSRSSASRPASSRSWSTSPGA
jgi:hypothetical protein